MCQFKKGIFDLKQGNPRYNGRNFYIPNLSCHVSCIPILSQLVSRSMKSSQNRVHPLLTGVLYVTRPGWIL